MVSRPPACSTGGLCRTRLAAAGGVLALYFLAFDGFVVGSVPGWTSLIVVQLPGLAAEHPTGITALYIGKIFEASQQRPLFVLQDRIDGAELAARARTDRTGEPLS